MQTWTRNCCSWSAGTGGRNECPKAAGLHEGWHRWSAGLRTSLSAHRRSTTKTRNCSLCVLAACAFQVLGPSLHGGLQARSETSLKLVAGIHEAMEQLALRVQHVEDPKRYLLHVKPSGHALIAGNRLTLTLTGTQRAGGNVPAGQRVLACSCTTCDDEPDGLGQTMQCRRREALLS